MYLAIEPIPFDSYSTVNCMENYMRRNLCLDLVSQCSSHEEIALYNFIMQVTAV